MADPDLYNDTDRLKKITEAFQLSSVELKHAEAEWESHYLKLLEFGA